MRRQDAFVRLDKPADAQVHTFGDWLLLKLRADWTVGGQTHAGGSLLAVNFDAFLQGGRQFTTLFKPTPRKSLVSISATKNFLILNELENVRSRPWLLRETGGRWTRTPIEAPAFGNVGVHGIDDDESDDYFMTVTDFLTPSSLYSARRARRSAKSSRACRTFSGRPDWRFSSSRRSRRTARASRIFKSAAKD